MRRPRRTHGRRRRRRDDSEDRSERSDRSWSGRYGSRRRRTSGMSNNEGLLGWFLVPRSTPYRYTERKYTRSSWAGGGRGTADD